MTSKQKTLHPSLVRMAKKLESDWPGSGSVKEVVISQACSGLGHRAACACWDLPRWSSQAKYARLYMFKRTDTYAIVRFV
jgi:hypothetical protein